ncbi:MAG: GNAT family N-acetyltransferase [bacterium]
MSLNKPSTLQTTCIETPRLLLVPNALKYRDDIFREFTVEITVYMNPTPAKHSSETEAFITRSLQELQQGKTLPLVILKKETEEFLGCLGLHNIDGKTPEMGIWTKQSAHGHGYGREAMAAVKHWADEHLTYDHLIYPVAEKNISSQKIPLSLGGKLVKEYDKTGMGGNFFHCLEYWIYPEK